MQNEIQPILMEYLIKIRYGAHRFSTKKVNAATESDTDSE